MKTLKISVKNENRPSLKEKPTKHREEKAPSLEKKDTKSGKHKTSVNQYYNSAESLNLEEKSAKSAEENRPSLEEKPTKLPNKKLQYLIYILLMSGAPLSIDELMELLEYRHKDTFRRNYIKPLETIGFIKKICPEKPTAPNQKYLITGQGKRFLTAMND